MTPTTIHTLPDLMPAVHITAPGGPDMLALTSLPVPRPGPGEVLIDVQFAGINRPDVLQRQGAYPPPPGASPLPGLEVSGTIAACGPGADRWHPGDQVCALLPGGGYARYAVTPAGHCLPVPASITMREAAALPETVFTVWSNVFERARLVAGETLVVHGGTSGIGTTAILLAKAMGAKVIATVGSDEKRDFCLKLGADGAVNYKTDDFAAEVQRLTEKRGADVILDMVGAPYLERNLKSLTHGGRLTIIALQGGSQGPVDLRRILTHHLTITASTLRPRSVDEKTRLARAVEEHVWPLVASGRLHPVLDSLYPMSQAAAAHRRMESGDHRGKIVLAMQD